MANPSDDLRTALEGAFEEQDKPEVTTTVTEQQAEETPAERSERLRDESGRFAKAEAQEPKPEPVAKAETPVAQVAQDGALRLGGGRRQARRRLR